MKKINKSYKNDLVCGMMYLVIRMKVKIAISARHVHLTRDDYNYLFDNDMTICRNLGQSGQFAANEKVSIITNKDRIDNVRIVGPVRSYTQVEISKTDAYKLGINPPVSSGGVLDDAETITISANGKSIEKKCCIIADRHIHVVKNDLDKYNLKLGQIVKLKVFGKKGATLENVKIREGYGINEAHLDTDDANANLIDTDILGEVIYE